MSATSHKLYDGDGLASNLRDNTKLFLCAASGRKAVFMPMHTEVQSEEHEQQLLDVPAIRIVMSDLEGIQIPSSEKPSISSIEFLPCRQLVLLGCDGVIHVCL